MAGTLVSFLFLVLSCFFTTSVDGALTHQGVKKIRGSMKLTTHAKVHAKKAAKSMAKTKKAEDDDDDDDSDDDDDEDVNSDPAKAKLRKDLVENLRQQTKLKADLKQITDTQESNQEIDNWSQEVRNETQSPALGNMLGKMWKDMRMFEKPVYKEHVEKQLAHLKHEERSTEDELSALESGKARSVKEDQSVVRFYGSEKCPCVGIDNLEGETIAVVDKEGKKAAYPADLGARCEAWDLKEHPKCPGESWCKQKWCYVDPCNCDIPILPKEAVYIPGGMYQGKPIHFSYATCGGEDSWTTEQDKKELEVAKKDIAETCAVKVNEDKWGDEDCRCVGIGPQPGTTKVNIKGKMVDFPADTGATCEAWEQDNHPDCQGKDKPDWCSQAWCYVDPCKCKLPTPPKTSSYLPEGSYQGKPVYFSYATCGGEDAYTAGNKEACVNQKTAGACATLDKCAWSGKECLGKELVNVCKDEVAVKSMATGLKAFAALLLPALGFFF